MVLNSEVLLRHAWKIKGIVEDQSFPSQEKKEEVFTLFYHLLTKRRLQEDTERIWQGFLESKESEYAAQLQSIRPDHSTIEVTNHYEVGSEHIGEIKSLGSSEVYYKEYFTIPLISKEEAAEHFWKFILRFIKAYNEIAHSLVFLGNYHRTFIACKVPIRLKDLLSHNDSLVIHYTKKDLRAAIQVIVRNKMRDQAVPLIQRKGRVNSGFDIERSNLFKTINKRYASHTKLIALSLTQQITDNVARFQNLSLQQWESWIKQSIQKLNTWTEEMIENFLE